MIAAIVATDLTNGIGFKNKLLVNIKEDLQYFKALTTSNIVIMGRNTYESLPKKPLPNRVNIVITHHPETIEGNAICMDLDEVKAWLKKYGTKTANNIFVIGGEQIYKELLPYCERVYLTKIYKKFDEVDAYFPDITASAEWGLSSTSEGKEENGIDYQFRIYDRKGYF